MSLLLRRQFIAACSLATPSVWRSAQAQGPLQPTPRQSEGPFYPLDWAGDRDGDLLTQGSTQYRKGTAVTLKGQVVDTAGRAVSGATVEIWQCDAEGHYHHPADGARADRSFQGHGRVQAAADGRYQFRTIRPLPYTGRTPHVHLKVWLGSRELLTTQIYVEAEAGNARDGLWQRLSPSERQRLTVPFNPTRDGLEANFPIVVRT